MPQQARPRPPITDAMRANARQNPNTWLYVIDEAFDPGGKVPPFAVVGAYPVDDEGQIIDDFHANERYRPSPKALGLPEPGNELERVLQLVWTAHLPASALTAAVLSAALHVYAVSPVQNTLTGCYDRSGRVVVPAFTRRELLPRDWPCSRALSGRTLASLLAGHPLAINPGRRVGAVIPAERLAAALGAD